MTVSSTHGSVSEHSHTDASDAAPGFMCAAHKTKLDGVASGATANDSDANLKNRQNHTGEQAIASITGLQGALDAKAAASHGHAIGDTTGLQTALDGKAASSHSHAISEVTSLQTTLDAKLNTSDAAELIRDTMATALVQGSNVTITPNDGADTITIAATGGGGGATLVSAFLTSPQANSTVTPAVLTGHSFTLTPGQVLQLVGQVVCTSAATTTGFAVGVRVAQGAVANGNAIGSAATQVAIANAAAATQLFDADVFNVAGGANALFEVLGTASTSGNNGAGYHLAVKNLSTNVNTTVTIEFRSEVGTSAVTAQIGTGCAGVKG